MADNAAPKIQRAPFPTDPAEFNDDDRVSFDQVSQSHKLEDEAGEEWEWLPRPAKWVPVMDEALVQQQQRAYAIEGVDENEPAMDPRKRKAAAEADGEANGKNKKQKPEKPPPPSKAIYVTSLPLDADEDEIYEVFQRYGVIDESAETNKPRVKLYTDDNGKFKGDALIVYFRPESVQLAIDMLDDSDFRLGQKLSTGPMRVSVADQSFKSQKEPQSATGEAKAKGSNTNRSRQNAIKKKEEMNDRTAKWDDDDPSELQQVSSRWDKVVVLKHMFTLKELAEDPAALLDIKDDIRTDLEEKFGAVTNVVMYDKEPDGVATVRFADKTAAQAAIRALNGRKYDGRTVECYQADGVERFMKSHKGDTEGEAERLESFGKFLEGEEE